VHEQLMRDYYATYNNEDAEALSAFYHPEVELHSAQGVMRGLEEVLTTYRHLVATFEDRMHPTAMASRGDTIEIEITDRLTARTGIDDFMGSSLAAGETLTLKLRGTYRIEDQQLRHIEIELLEASLDA